MISDLSIIAGVFSTLLAIINPLEALPIYLSLLQGEDESTHRTVAFRSCLYAAIMMVFFLFFGKLMMHLFGVSLSMVRVVGGIILVRIGFSLFSSPGGDLEKIGAGQTGQRGNIAFVPLAMPIMFGPGALATVIGFSTLLTFSDLGKGVALGFCLAIVATMAVTFAILVNGRKILSRIGPLAIDAMTRLVGFFVSAMGMGLIFHGVGDAIREFLKGA
ncbi:MAG TPA: MarC family protein [Geobacteraceae bacterium]|nr:MarC family protein [Geobacteraceae bacterium]